MLRRRRGELARRGHDAACRRLPRAGLRLPPRATGTRFGPRDIRQYPVRYSGWGGWKTSGYWDINDKKRKLATTRIVDCGDVDVAYYDIERNMRLITQSASAILERNALPVMLGGDHSVTFPLVRAFERFAPLDIVHFDAHLDWIDHVEGIKFANGSPFRRISELPAGEPLRRSTIRPWRAHLRPLVPLPRARHVPLFASTSAFSSPASQRECRRAERARAKELRFSRR